MHLVAYVAAYLAACLLAFALGWRTSTIRRRRAVKPRPFICTRCHRPINGGSFVGDGDGSMKDGGRFAHYDCYFAQRYGCGDPDCGDCNPHPDVVVNDGKVERVQ